MFYLYGLSIKPTQGVERFPERRELAICLWIFNAHEDANASRLLCVRRKRPHSYSA
jgi:hypothetical protein